MDNLEVDITNDNLPRAVQYFLQFIWQLQVYGNTPLLYQTKGQNSSFITMALSIQVLEYHHNHFILYVCHPDPSVPQRGMHSIENLITINKICIQNQNHVLRQIPAYSVVWTIGYLWSDVILLSLW